MVYCNLERINGTKLLYSIGGIVTDITGKIIVDYKSGEYKLIKAPEKYKVHDYYIRRLLNKVQADYDKGIFEKKISYEIG